MRGLIIGAVFLWLASAFYFVISWDLSPDSFLEWAATVIVIGGIVLGLLGAIVVVVTGIWSGHKEKKQWE
jgi:hypothetical protein